MSRLLIPQLSFADLQLQSLGIHLDPSLQRIADFLEKHSDLVELVRKDLERGLKKPNAGRHGITPAQTLRSLILMRVKNWDYRELRERINDGLHRPGEFHPEALTDSGREPLDSSGSCHPVKAAAFCRNQRVPPVAR